MDPNASTQPKQRVTTIVLAALAICFVGLRLCARAYKRMPLGSDDWMLVVGLIFVLVVAGINLACIQYGMGRHTATLNQTDLPIFFKLIYTFEPLYITTVGIIKLSVLLMYHRIFPVRFIRLGGYILGGITIAWVISVDLVAIFQCRPIHKAYEPLTPGSCINLKAALIGNGVPNFVTDICILALPAKCIWRLQATRLQRVSIIAVFLTGSFVVFASIYRFSLIFVFDERDIAWTLADAQTWCVVEIAAGVISACLPTIIPLLKAVSRGFVSTARTLTRSNHTMSASQGGKSKSSRVGLGGDEVGSASGPGIGGGGGKGNGGFALGEIGGSHLNGHGNGVGGGKRMSGKGWTVITADAESD